MTKRHTISDIRYSRAIVHVDADSFFASVIVRSHPGLRGKPVLAIGMGGGCVIAATYEAKAKGVKTGMRLSDARKLVPECIEMPVDFRETGIASEQIESVLRSSIPILEQMSIDEWYGDLSSMVGGTPKDVHDWVKAMQKEVLTSTGLSVSVGVAPTKLLAKMASEYRKPAGVSVIHTKDIETFLRDRPAAAIPGIGRQRQVKTDDMGWKTAWDIASADDAALVRICGKPGILMRDELRGIAHATVSTVITPPKSISRCRTFQATTDTDLMKAHLVKHLEYCTMKMRRWDRGCRELSVWVRTPDFDYRGSHRKLGRLCVTVEEMSGPALASLSALTWHGSRVNQVGLALSGFDVAATRQQSLFDDPKSVMETEKLQETIDTLHQRFGRDSVTRGAALRVSSGTKKDIDFSIVEGGS